MKKDITVPGVLLETKDLYRELAKRQRAALDKIEVFLNEAKAAKSKRVRDKLMEKAESLSHSEMVPFQCDPDLVGTDPDDIGETGMMYHVPGEGWTSSDGSCSQETGWRILE